MLVCINMFGFYTQQFFIQLRNLNPLPGMEEPCLNSKISVAPLFPSETQRNQTKKESPKRNQTKKESPKRNHAKKESRQKGIMSKRNCKKGIKKELQKRNQKGQVRSGQFMSCQVMSSQAKSGRFRSCQVRFDSFLQFLFIPQKGTANKGIKNLVLI